MSLWRRLLKQKSPGTGSRPSAEPSAEVVSAPTDVQRQLDEQLLVLAGTEYDKKRLNDWHDYEYRRLPYLQGIAMDELISRGANINAKDKMGRTVLHLVICCGSEVDALNLSRHVLDKGVDRDHVAGGISALSLAASLGYPMVVLQLIQKGATIGTSSSGVTALHLAAHCGHLETVKTLLEHGADPHAMTQEGATPGILALQQGHMDVAAFLSSANADIKSYFECSRPTGDGTCSDNECPCGLPGTTLQRGSGYLYISKEVVDFRRDARTEAEATAKIASIEQQSGIVITNPNSLASAILICKQAALKRGIDLEIASRDASHWWETGEVPLRPTPSIAEHR